MLCYVTTKFAYYLSVLLKLYHLSICVVNSSISHGHLNALKLLLKHKLWSESINLVQKLADNSLTHSELFHVLLTSLLQVSYHL